MRALLLLFAFSSFAFAKIAPSFQGELLSGGRSGMRQFLRPNRGLLLSFWASWCAPCLEELKHVTEKLKSDPSLPLDLLTVNVDRSETLADVKPTLKLYRFSFPVILDSRHEIFSKYQQADTLPFSVLIGPDGELLTSFTGYNETMFPAIQRFLGPRVKKINGPSS